MTILDNPVLFIATTKAVESRGFYENVLGLKFSSEDAFALVFDLGTTSLRIQKVEFVPQVNYTVLGWEVVNIQECVARLTEQGVLFERFSQLQQDESGVWRAPGGACVAWFKDPDGNVLSLTQPVA